MQYCTDWLFHFQSLNLYFLGNLACGAASGVATIAIIYPLDFTRTRLAVDMGRKKKDREFRGGVDFFLVFFYILASVCLISRESDIDFPIGIVIVIENYDYHIFPCRNHRLCPEDRSC